MRLLMIVLISAALIISYSVYFMIGRIIRSTSRIMIRVIMF